MRIIAIIMVRNGADYAEKCILHLLKNGIEIAVIDQSSNDGTYEICQSFVGNGICELQRIKYPGYFSLGNQLQEKNKLISTLQTDWVIHHDIDECLDAPDPNMSLYESIKLVDKQGFTAINFNEFVFLPYDETVSFYDSQYYYFFEPFFPRLMRAWKKSAGLSSLQSGGHILQGEMNLSPVSYTLRHYIFTSQQHAFDKYSNRRFSTEEIQNGWHKNRVNIEHDKLIFPERDKLEMLSYYEPEKFSVLNPWRKHYWE